MWRKRNPRAVPNNLSWERNGSWRFGDIQWTPRLQRRFIDARNPLISGSIRKNENGILTNLQQLLNGKKVYNNKSAS